MVSQEAIHEGKKGFECDKCDKHYALKEGLTHHMERAHGAPRAQKSEHRRSRDRQDREKKEFECEICCRIFTRYEFINYTDWNYVQGGTENKQ